MTTNKEIVTIDAAKLFFACLIPLLHINGMDAFGNILSQYISRLGVPFFFVVSGFFLSQKLGYKNSSESITGKITY